MLNQNELTTRASQNPKDPIPAVGEGQLQPYENPRRETFIRLTKMTSKSEIGIIQEIYRPDLIPADLFDITMDEQEDILSGAMIRIGYEEGYPSQPDGTLFWDPLPFESDADYGFFSQYIKLSESHGFRTLQNLVDDSLPFEARKKQLAYLRDIFVYNYWDQRTKAYDLVGLAAYRKLRDRRAIETEDYAYIKSTNMLGKIVGRLGDVLDDPEELELMDIPELIKAMKDLNSIQRVASGLPEKAPLDLKRSEEADSSLEYHLKTIAKRNSADDDGDTMDEMDIGDILDDPNAALMAQELIIKMQRKNR